MAALGSRLLLVRRSSRWRNWRQGAPARRRLALGSGAAIFLLLVAFLFPASAQQFSVPLTCQNTTAISQAASAQIITGTAGKKTHLCGVFVLAADAENVSLVGGTGTVCATGVYAIIGGTTAATGPNLLAGGSFTLWSPTLSLQAPSAAATGDHLCLLQSGTGRVAGVLTWTQY